MHIPDNYLSPSTCAVMTAAVVPAWVHSVKKLKAELPREKMALLGVGAAFSFLGMMFNIPMPGGTTGHAVGGTLIALLLGPEAACIAVTIALLIQALLFGDGGILAFGANCFNMAFVLPYVGYSSTKLLRKLFKAEKLITASAPDGCADDSQLMLNSEYLDESSSNRINRRDQLAVAIGSYLGINAAALMTAIEFGIQPMLFTSVDGTPLYCPYGLSISIPAMMIGHLTIFGLAEVIFTVAIYKFLGAHSADQFYGNVGEFCTSENAEVRVFSATTNSTTTNTTTIGENQVGGFGSKKAGILLAVLIVATPLGLIAAGTAWGEWDIADMPTITESFSWNSVMPDYSLDGSPEVAAYILAAVIGVSIMIILFRVIGALMKSNTKY